MLTSDRSEEVGPTNAWLQQEVKEQGRPSPAPASAVQFPLAKHSWTGQLLIEAPRTLPQKQTRSSCRTPPLLSGKVGLTHRQIRALAQATRGVHPPRMMSIIHRLAGKLFHRAGHFGGGGDGGEDGHERPQEELEAYCWCEFSPRSCAGGGRPRTSV